MNNGIRKTIFGFFGVIVVVYAVIEVFFGAGIRQWWDQYSDTVLWSLFVGTIIIVIVLIIWRMRDRIGRYFDEKREEKRREESLERQRKFDEDKKRKEEEEIAKGNRKLVDENTGEEQWVSRERWEELEWERKEQEKAEELEKQRREYDAWYLKILREKQAKEFENKEKVRIIRIIEEFEPRKRYDKEIKYQEALYVTLHQDFENIIWEKELDGKNPDYVIDDVCIELKGKTDLNHLKSISEKVPRYLQEWKFMIVVLYDITTPQTTYENWKKGFVDMIGKYLDEDGIKRVFLIEDISSFKDDIRRIAEVKKKSLIEMKWFNEPSYKL